MFRIPGIGDRLAKKIAEIGILARGHGKADYSDHGRIAKITESGFVGSYVGDVYGDLWGREK